MYFSIYDNKNSNSLTSVSFQWDFLNSNLQANLMIACRGISYEITIRWLLLNFTDGKSTLVQVIAWRYQATSHYMKC